MMNIQQSLRAKAIFSLFWLHHACQSMLNIYKLQSQEMKDHLGMDLRSARTVPKLYLFCILFSFSLYVIIGIGLGYLATDPASARQDLRDSMAIMVAAMFIASWPGLIVWKVVIDLSAWCTVVIDQGILSWVEISPSDSPEEADMKWRKAFLTQGLADAQESNPASL